ncbi:hypothetical protein QJS66_12100 [Kocuria rhizophila]|nr:hypothetical protein QJS66_12100 [Kocuria rhizophila]
MAGQEGCGEGLTTAADQHDAIGSWMAPVCSWCRWLLAVPPCSSSTRWPPFSGYLILRRSATGDAPSHPAAPSCSYTVSCSGEKARTWWGAVLGFSWASAAVVDRHGPSSSGSGGTASSSADLPQWLIAAVVWWSWPPT